MNKRISKVNGYNISFLQNGESLDSTKATVLFIHGNSSSKNIFATLINHEQLGKELNLMAIDLPGHGESQHIPEAETNTEIYTIPFYVQTVKEFLVQMKIENIIAVGHSFGAHITTALSKMFPLSGLLNIQNTPIDNPGQVEKALSQDKSFQQLFTPEVTDIGLHALSNQFFSEKAPQSFFDNFKASDPYFRKNLVASLQSGIILNEIDYIKNLEIPYKLLIGANDPFTNTDYIIDLRLGDKVEFLVGSHYPMIEAPDEVASHIQKIYFKTI